MPKYSNAPVSEVILGVTFNSEVLKKDNFFLTIINQLKSDYPDYTVHNALPNEELSGNLRNLKNIAQHSGPILYRLKSKELDWLVQVQWNKLYVNWIRTDLEKVGKYPGFEALLSRFRDLYNKADSTLDISKEVNYLELTYHDRIEWQQYINDLGDIHNIINMNLAPLDSAFGSYKPINFITFKTYKIPELNGFATFNLNTETNKQGKQIIKTELSLKGKLSNEVDLYKWIKDARSFQSSFFEKLINPEILEKWK